MKDFIEDYWTEILLLIMIISGIFLISKYIDTQNKQRLAIINNTKDNVIKYSNCENIDNYYYCWND